jgi:hypothetical protein
MITGGKERSAAGQLSAADHRGPPCVSPKPDGLSASPALGPFVSCRTQKNSSVGNGQEVQEQRWISVWEVSARPGRGMRRSLVVTLFSLAFKFCNPAGMLPKFDVVTVNHSLGAFLRSVVIIADEIDGLDDVAIPANQVSSIVRHGWTIPDAGALGSPSSPSHTLDWRLDLGLVDAIRRRASRHLRSSSGLTL